MWIFWDNIFMCVVVGHQGRGVNEVAVLIRVEDICNHFFWLSFDNIQLLIDCLRHLGGIHFKDNLAHIRGLVNQF
jgi:hypothetical protein